MAWLRRFLIWLFRPQEVTIPYIPPLQPDISVPIPTPVPEPVKDVQKDVSTVEPVKTPQERIYDVAYASLGKHMGLDRTIPIQVNCANALTDILIKSGVKGLPSKGIPGTANLYAWLKKSKDFKEIQVPEKGDIVIYPTGYDDPNVPGMPSLANGHVFIKGKHQMLSNNSKTGKWDNAWASLDAADLYYTKLGGIPRFCFRWNPQS